MLDTTFTDVPMHTHWTETDFSNILWDEQYQMGRVYQLLGQWAAEPYWEHAQSGTTYHETEEEAKAYLLAIYKFTY